MTHDDERGRLRKSDSASEKHDSSADKIQSTADSPESEQAAKVESNKATNIRFIIFAAVLLLLLVGLVVVPQQQKKHTLQEDKYNGFDFVKQSNGLWFTRVVKDNQPYDLEFYYHPRDLEDIGVEANLRNKFFALRDTRGIMYIAVDPESPDSKVVIAGIELVRITGDRYGLLNVTTQSAFSRQPVSATTNTQSPVVDCKQATTQVMVVEFVLSDKNMVYSSGNCILLQAKTTEDYIRVADRLTYHLLGIMS